MNNYLDGLKSAFLGEYFGEALCLSLSQHFATSLRDQKKLAILAYLERVMQGRLGDIAASLVTDAECKAASTAGRAYALELKDLDWAALMRALSPRVKRANESFKRLLEEAPSDHREAIERLIEHELALESFFNAETNGTPRSLDAVVHALIDPV
jgi:hypothetical protein